MRVGGVHASLPCDAVEVVSPVGHAFPMVFCS